MSKAVLFLKLSISKIIGADKLNRMTIKINA
jgi:hypothetical protein